MYEITKVFTFEASHRLWDNSKTDKENYEIFGKCANPPSHGHSYKVEILLKNEKLTNGMVRNFSEIKDVFKERIHKKLDHHFLNDILPGLTTAENIAHWIFMEMLLQVSEIEKVTVWETATCSGAYQP